jgi:hypothetical protein
LPSACKFITDLALNGILTDSFTRGLVTQLSKTKSLTERSADISLVINVSLNVAQFAPFNVNIADIRFIASNDVANQSATDEITRSVNGLPCGHLLIGFLARFFVSVGLPAGCRQQRCTEYRQNRIFGSIRVVHSVNVGLTSFVNAEVY